MRMMAATATSAITSAISTRRGIVSRVNGSTRRLISVDMKNRTEYFAHIPFVGETLVDHRSPRGISLEHRHVVDRIRPQPGLFKPSIDGEHRLHEERRDEVRHEGEVTDIDEPQTGDGFQSIRLNPPFDPLVDLLEEREDVAHVEAKQRVSRVRLVDDEHATRSEHARDLGERDSLCLAVRQVMQDANGIDEVETLVSERQLQRAARSD